MTVLCVVRDEALLGGFGIGGGGGQGHLFHRNKEPKFGQQETQYRAWNTTMGKLIHDRKHNDCQQLITKSHG